MTVVLARGEAIDTNRVFSDDMNNFEKYCGFDGYVLAKAVEAERRNTSGGERLVRGMYAWMRDLGISYVFDIFSVYHLSLISMVC
jgi:hypothetical protein